MRKPFSIRRKSVAVLSVALLLAFVAGCAAKATADALLTSEGVQHTVGLSEDLVHA
jgi:hypothetical protein